MLPYRSSVSPIDWPAIPNTDAARLLALQFQLDETEHMEPEAIDGLQMRALGELLRHARATVPYYRDDPAYDLADGAALTAESWAKLPVLTKAMAQDAGSALHSESVPDGHGKVGNITTSGSTGRPLSVLTTGVTKLFWQAITLRDQLWHRRDFGGTVAVIRPDPHRRCPPGGALLDDWGPPVSSAFKTGPMALMGLQADVAAQADWLVALNPRYLLSLPSNLASLTDHFRRTGQRLPRLEEVVSIGETLTPEVRAACREIWDARVADIYSSQELGYLALQCPAGEVYHVQSEVVRIEVVDEHDQPCGPGETGRVVVTAFHNFAMPLVRYDIGDYAEVGSGCGCQRRLPVLERILGRQRNILLSPSGQRMWPTFASAWMGIDAIRQIQLVQAEVEHFVARIAGPRSLTGDEERLFTERLRHALGFDFSLDFEYLERIERSKGGKFEDFISLVTPGIARP